MCKNKWNKHNSTAADINLSDFSSFIFTVHVKKVEHDTMKFFLMYNIIEEEELYLTEIDSILNLSI